MIMRMSEEVKTPEPLPPEPVNAGVGLVLEGGGMRGAYTAGVLDAFLGGGIDIPYVIGVSSGSNAGADHVVEQRERNHRMSVELAAARYAGFRNVLGGRSWFGMDFLFEAAPDQLAPFDYEPLRLDGGVSSHIPIARSIEDGNARNVVVLTRGPGYRKRRRLSGPLLSLGLVRHPGVRRASLRRHLVCSVVLDRPQSLERDGKVFIIRPSKPPAVGRMERDVKKLEALYRQGYEEATGHLPALRLWMGA